MPFSEASNGQSALTIYASVVFRQTTKRKDGTSLSHVSFGYLNIFQYQRKQLKIILKNKNKLLLLLLFWSFNIKESN
jgi:hypothetical protein